MQNGPRSDELRAIDENRWNEDYILVRMQLSRPHNEQHMAMARVAAFRLMKFCIDEI